MITIYRNIFAKEHHYISIETALKRIKDGKSKASVEAIRNTIDKERRNSLKQNLPSVCFSGKFNGERKDNNLIKHSGFIVLDFDNVEDVVFEKEELKNNKYIYACWISPSGNGLKALVKIANVKKHRGHFVALQDEFKNLDESGINVSRVCYESFDKEIYINRNSKVFNKLIKVEKQVEVNTTTGNAEKFKKILTWLSNRGDAFVQGERNIFLFKLGAACCRFGINESECINFASISFTDSTFKSSELERTIKSSYKTNGDFFGTAEFTSNKLVDKKTKGEIKKEINPDVYNLDVKPKDVIYGEEVKQKALNIYRNGYKKVDGIGVTKLDYHWKMKKGEITLLTGIGNYGKSSFFKWYMLVRMIKYDDRFAIFAPEDNPAEEFYHDMTEIYLGCDCTPFNKERPKEEIYDKAYNWISERIFFIYPNKIAPTPDYIKERFLELIIKEKVVGCIIDPFNQMSNNYSSSGGRSDKYLETFLSDCSRFAQINNIYFLIVAHPKIMRKDDTGNYPCPDVFDIADGAMWNNKMDNIIVYHRPNHQENPNGAECEFHSKKIRRQKVVGKKGFVVFELNRKSRRFFFDGYDVIAYLLKECQVELNYNPNAYIEPNKDFEDDIINDLPF